MFDVLIGDELAPPSTVLLLQRGMCHHTFERVNGGLLKVCLPAAARTWFISDSRQRYNERFQNRLARHGRPEIKGPRRVNVFVRPPLSLVVADNVGDAVVVTRVTRPLTPVFSICKLLI